jgi:cytochrome b pre-mRNA-processing protein 3
MKDYINIFYAMIDKIDNWEDLSSEYREIVLTKFIDKQSDPKYLAIYFEKYRQNLINNPLNSYLKGVLKP